MARITLGDKLNRRKAFILGKFANRHGLVAGATGTGKTVTLQTMAESFSRAGVPVFLADIKGDVAGLAMDGQAPAYPVMFWDCFGKQGFPAQITIAELGPELLARLLELTEAQAGCLEIGFAYAEDVKFRLNTLTDLQRLLRVLTDNKEVISQQYGLVSASSVAAVQRSLLRLIRMGGTSMFGAPVMDIDRLMQKRGKHGQINILAADELVKSPQIYAMFMVWLLVKLYNSLPEVGDRAKPKLVLFIDEAHLLFADCPAFILRRIEQVVRLIRSKGVGIYFVTQSPMDIPSTILTQLGNRVQHALRASTMADQRAIRAAADTFTPNPEIDSASLISRLKVGQALVSVINENGQPSPVELVKIKLPNCRLGAITQQERDAVNAKHGYVKDDSKRIRSSLYGEEWSWCPKKSTLTMMLLCVVMMLFGVTRIPAVLLFLVFAGIYVKDFHLKKVMI